MRRRRATAATAGTGVLLASALLGTTTSTAAGAPTAQGQLFLVQAVPGQVVDVEVGGRMLGQDVATGDVVGPIDLPTGTREVTLSTDQWSVVSDVSVDPRSATDVVLHRPAAPDGEPVVSTYRIPDRPIGPEEARVLVAHTATAPPADVSVDGRTVFRNIANGEYAEADVPAGGHRVALLPSGTARGAFLGPLDVDLPAGTVTMVYAVGSPQDNSMRVVSHVAGLSSDGSVAPSRIETGSSAGVVEDLLVSPFGRR